MAGFLVACGARLVDTDAIARSLTLPGGAAMPALVAAFGAEFAASDGGLDRDRMRALAFADPHAKRTLESVLHPLIGIQAEREAGAAPAGDAVVFDVPLLAEGKGPRPWRLRVDRVLVVDCAEATQLQRVARRPGWDEEAACRVIAQQASRPQRRAVADAVICNDSTSLSELEAEVRALWSLWNNLGTL